MIIRQRKPPILIVDNAVIDEWGPHIGALGIAAYCGLVYCISTPSPDPPQSIEQRLATLLNMTPKATLKALQSLEDWGLITTRDDAYILLDLEDARPVQRKRTARNA